MTFARLLAKSSHMPDTPRRAETLDGHLADVTRVASLLAEEWGERYLTSLGLGPETFLSRLKVALPRAAFLHDLGKANDHFQRMIRSPATAAPQACWHEQLSVWLMLAVPRLDSWYFAGCDLSLRNSILAAVVGHHLRVDDVSKINLREHSGTFHLDVLSGHTDFQAALRSGAELLDLAGPPRLDDMRIDLIEQDSFDEVMRRWLSNVFGWWRTVTEEERRYIAALKALLIAVDVAGSAIPRSRVDPAIWTEEKLRRVCVPDDLAQIAERRLPAGLQPRPFQRAVQTSPARVTFVRAGCGSGKTVAAYLWAAQKSLGRKLFFCYPTTGTASQGFDDYVPPDVAEAVLIHSRSAVDLEDILANGSDEARNHLDQIVRFAALAAWIEPITVCTVDTVLGLMQNNRRGVFSFPAIADGAFVFDEIHQYDDRLFAALLRFLETFRGVPILLMTASLPRARLLAIRDLLARLGEQFQVVEGPADLQALKRYRMVRADRDYAWTAAVAVIERGGRVLWVANTVERAVQLAHGADAKGLSVLPYHSRYRYEDRLKRHRAVVNAFTGEKGSGILAVTTQVCEISLDLSADLLVTDLAPVAALIQRLGRLNRRATPDHPMAAAPALILDALNPSPYTDEDFNIARQWLDLLGEGPISQADLASAFDHVVGDDPAPSAGASAWLDGGVLAAPAPVREAGMTIPVVRAEDLTEIRHLPDEELNRQVIRRTIPMLIGPVAREIGGWERIGTALVAPAGRIEYGEWSGGHWR